MDSSHTTVVVGASLAGMHAARTLRLEGHAGSIVVLDADRRVPYDKPPLSKQVLSQGWEAEKITLPAATEELGLDLRLGVRATGLDLTSRRVAVDALDGPGEVPFDTLVLATGAAARRLPGTDDIDGVHVVRSLDDALELRADLEAAPSRVVVIGAGFIGAEVAASCRTLGLEVTLVEALPVPLERVLGAEMGAVCARVHVENGVDVRLGTGIDHFDTIPSEGGRRRVTGVALTDGTSVAAEVVVVGIGVSVNTGWLEGSGLTLDDGIVCDETLLAAPGITAAGDVCRWPNPLFDGEPTRLEHWTNAAEQGVAAAARLLAADRDAKPFAPVPFVWSDQYETKIQVAGLVRGDDEIEVVDGSLEERTFVAAVGRRGRLVGAVAFSRPRVLMQYRRLIAERTTFDDALAVARQGA